jgi:hypothetical protein
MNRTKYDNDAKTVFTVKSEESLELLKAFLMIEDQSFAPTLFQWSNRQRPFNRKASLFHARQSGQADN